MKWVVEMDVKDRVKRCPLKCAKSRTKVIKVTAPDVNSAKAAARSKFPQRYGRIWSVYTMEDWEMYHHLRASA